MLCVGLVFIAWLRLITGFDLFWQKQLGYQLAEEITDQTQVWVMGKVYQKKSDKIYLSNVSISQTNGDSAENDSKSSKIRKLNRKLIMEETAEIKEMKGISVGDQFVISGEFASFNEATNPGEFDSKAYYRSIDIGGKIKKAKLLKVKSAGWNLGEMLTELRNWFHDRLYKILPKREASIMATMLLGEKDGLDEQIKEIYQKNGIIHILSISGLHITLIGLTIFEILRRCGVGVKASALTGAILLIGYGILTGMSVSATRAIGMYLIRMGAFLFERTYDLLTGISIMAAISCTLNPACLMNSGFLLSYSAVLGPVLLLPALQNLLGIETKRRRSKVRLEGSQKIKEIWEKLTFGLMQSMLASLSISITTMPILLSCYYEIPLYAPVLNLLVLPFMGLLVGCGLAVPGLGIFSTCSYWILKYFDVLCGWFSKLPMSRLNPGCPPKNRIIIYYLIWGGVILVGKAERKDRIRAEEKGSKLATMGTMAILALMSCLMLLPPKRDTQVTFLDVGQGDCICMELKSGEVYLFDCGSSSRRNVGEYLLLPFLKYRGIQKLNGVYISHNDIDHRNGIDELLEFAGEEGISIEEVYEPGEMVAGMEWQTSGAGFKCLHPEPEEAMVRVRTK